MALSNENIKRYTKRLLLSRMRILCSHGFFGLLLMYAKYGVDEEVPTAYTNGEKIVFGTDFLDSLSDSELDFVMMHEIMHIVLQHCKRGENFEPERYNIACDIVVNSNILLENGMQSKSITLKKYGESMHLAPDGKEGYAYTAEQVYNMLPNISSNLSNVMPGSYKAGNVGNPKDTLEVGTAQANESKNQWHWEKGRAEKTKADAEDIYKGCWDDHSHWQETEEDEELRDVWVKRFEDAAKAISIREASNCRGTVPTFAKRILEELSNPQINWRTILNDFIQEEICDYSFSPPDRRFDDNPFFLPDFNEKEEVVKDILFMIDTSGSMSNKMITAAYSEIKGAIDQFGGKLKGWLGFFDAAIIEPVPFEDEEEFKIIRPAGGGGTDFQIIFEYINEYMKDTPPASVIILTDGYAPFPQESCAKGVPVLWLINNDEVEPPWGKVARIKV